ncbi:MAG: hypothetical protein WCF23_10670 [Candidatus Nitrosopolaris sp.]
MLSGLTVLVWIGVIGCAAACLEMQSIIVIVNKEHKINNRGEGDPSKDKENFKLLPSF